MSSSAQNADPLLAVIDAVRDAASAAVDALSTAIDALSAVREQRCAGAGVVTVIDGVTAAGRIGVRRDAARAIVRYQHAVMDLRAHAVRDCVEHEQLSLTEIARRMGISRQMASRLYALARREQRARAAPRSLSRSDPASAASRARSQPP